MVFEAIFKLQLWPSDINVLFFIFSLMMMDQALQLVDFLTSSRE